MSLIDIIDISKKMYWLFTYLVITYYFVSFVFFILIIFIFNQTTILFHLVSLF